MLYFKKQELAETYHVADKTVSNWIKESMLGKLDLALYEKNGRSWIANTTSNRALIEQLIEKRKKFRNSRGNKTVNPKAKFYNLFSQKQIFDIASNLDIRREIPFQYGYFDCGATYWDKYAQRLASETHPNFLNSTILQLRTSRDYIDHLTSQYNKVNVIDIGPGNAMPARDLLEHFVRQDRLGRYIAVDISPAMLKIAKKNISKWFGGSVPYQGYEADINYDRFVDLIAQDTIGESAKDSVNLVLALGGTFANLRSQDGAFKIIHDSMNRDDILVYNLKLDSAVARQYFDFGIGEKTPLMDPQAQIMLDMLNIDESFYESEMGFDTQLRERYTRIRLKIALTIDFEFEKGKRAVEFNKNDTVLLWRYWHKNVTEVVGQLNRNDFDVLQTTITDDRDYLLVVARLKSER